MYRLMAILTGLVIWDAPALAQSWESRTGDNGSLYFGSATLQDAPISFGCTAPSPAGVPLIETGSHESHRSDPYEIILNLRDSLFDWAPPYSFENVVIGVGDAGYLLPRVDLNELQGTAVYISMADPMIGALMDAESFVLATGQGPVHSFSADGLGDALRTSFAFCANRWGQLGHAVPPGLGERLASAESTVPPTGLSLAEIPSEPFEVVMPAGIISHLTQQCGANYQIAPASMQVGYIDYDSELDFVLNWGDVTCQGQRGGGYCGAANCSIDIYLSGRGYTPLGDGLLGTDAQVVPLSNGYHGIQLNGTLFICADGYCDRPFYWTGTQLDLLNP